MYKHRTHKHKIKPAIPQEEDRAHETPKTKYVINFESRLFKTINLVTIQLLNSKYSLGTNLVTWVSESWRIV